MSWRDRAPRGSSPPKLTLNTIETMLFVVDGADVSGKEFVKVYKCLARNERLEDSPVVRHALAYLQKHGHVVYDHKAGRYAVAKEST